MMINSCLVSKSLNVTKHSTDIHTKKKKKKLNCRNKLGCFHNIQTNMEALLICKCYQCALCKLTYTTVDIFFPSSESLSSRSELGYETISEGY